MGKLEGSLEKCKTKGLSLTKGSVMEGFSVFHFLIILTVVVFFFFGGRTFKFPPFRGGPPTHPLPVTSPVETSRAAGGPDSDGFTSAS